jgi:excisionase family DNA binding protein
MLVKAFDTVVKEWYNRIRNERKRRYTIMLEDTKQTDGKIFVYTVRDVIAMTGLSENSVYSGIKKGEIPSIKIGRRILIPKRKFDEMLDGLTKKEDK